MLVLEKVSEIQSYSSSQKNEGTVGFVPTMGALHEGHLTLIKKAKQENRVVVASIFVNPTQFNDPKDLQNYPRTLEKDLEKLTIAGCDAAFVPTVSEMYPQGSPLKNYDFGYLETVMEGALRPGHFKGVAVIVEKLFRAVLPNQAYFGKKDYQQLTIIRELVKRENLPIEIIPCEIVREEDGLAMSSRNIRLTAEERKEAPIIYQTLIKAREMWGHSSINDLKEYVKNSIKNSRYFTLEYFEIVDAYTLRNISSLDKNHAAIGCIAVSASNVRLLDNVHLIS